MSYRKNFTKSGLCKIHKVKLKRVYFQGMIISYCPHCIPTTKLSDSLAHEVPPA